MPALTGYIAKSEDQQHIARARDLAVAARSVVSEMYTEEGAINELLVTNSPSNADFLTMGLHPSNQFLKADKRFYPINYMGSYVYNDVSFFMNQIADLTGTPFVSSGAGNWNINLVGSNSAGTTIFNADGFLYSLLLGANNGDPVIIVTYKMKEVTGCTTMQQFYAKIQNETSTAYDANEGYRVYHLVRP
ncbi:MAG: hypothetical protein LBL23_03890 [Coriobacteriales bacterium]|nr:hypothetical protein [Coriobacteriales bacterium]